MEAKQLLRPSQAAASFWRLCWHQSEEQSPASELKGWITFLAANFHHPGILLKARKSWQGCALDLCWLRASRPEWPNVPGSEGPKGRETAGKQQPCQGDSARTTAAELPQQEAGLQSPRMSRREEVEVLFLILGSQQSLLWPERPPNEWHLLFPASPITVLTSFKERTFNYSHRFTAEWSVPWMRQLLRLFGGKMGGVCCEVLFYTIKGNKSW